LWWTTNKRNESADSSVGRFDFPVANSGKSFTAEVKKVKIELAPSIYVATAQQQRLIINLSEVMKKHGKKQH